MIETPKGERAVESLVSGDLVQTLDSSPQPIRWVGRRTVPAIMGMEPVLFDKGSLGSNIPKRPMMLSRQHRLMLDTVVAERMTGTRQVLVPAHKLSEIPGVNIIATLGFVTYWHFLCDQHEIVFADGAPAETLFLGKQARKSMSSAALAEVIKLFPDMAGDNASVSPARTTMKGARQNRLINRLCQNAKHAVSMA